MLYIPVHKGNANQHHTKIPPHSCYSGVTSRTQQQQMLVTFWGKRNPHTLLLEM
jgi:hypothetical protein